MKIKKLFLVLCSFLCTSLASCSKGFDYSGYKVTWKDSDGSVIAVQYGVREGKYPICPEGNPSNKSKTKQFIDWSPKRSSVHGDVTYTAVYDDPSNPKTYSIDYHINEYSGERNSAFNVKTYSFGEYVVLYNPIKEGYDFEGWYDENGKQVITLDTYSCKDINLYPRWSIATYYVSFNYYPHELGDPYTETYDYGSYFSAYVLPIDGYEFEGWYKNGNFVTDLYSISFNVNDDVELVARYHALYGVSYDYMHDCYQIDSYYGTSTIITIPTYINGKLIEGISSYAFANSNIKEVTIPWSINYIGGYAFAYSAIESFYVSQGSQLFEIGNYCFYYCQNLDSVNLSYALNLASLSSSIFEYCSNLGYITLPENLQTINYHAFSYINVSIDVYIPYGVRNVGSYGFYNCPNMTVYVHDMSQVTSWNDDWQYNILKTELY